MFYEHSVSHGDISPTDIPLTSTSTIQAAMLRKRPRMSSAFLLAQERPFIRFPNPTASVNGSSSQPCKRCLQKATQLRTSPAVLQPKSRAKASSEYAVVQAHQGAPSKRTGNCPPLKYTPSLSAITDRMSESIRHPGLTWLRFAHTSSVLATNEEVMGVSGKTDCNRGWHMLHELLSNLLWIEIFDPRRFNSRDTSIWD